jgi:hypothetical protein
VDVRTNDFWTLPYDPVRTDTLGPPPQFKDVECVDQGLVRDGSINDWRFFLCAHPGQACRGAICKQDH